MGPCCAKSLMEGTASERSVSVFADEQSVGEGAQGFSFSFESIEGTECATGEICGGLSGFFEAEECGVGCFDGFDVFAGGFAEFLSALGDIEDVIDDLKSEAETGTELRERIHLGGGCICTHGTEAEGCREEGSRFCGMDEAECGWRDGFAFVLEIEDLTSNELCRPGSHRQLAHECGGRVTFCAGMARDDFECNGQESIAGEDGNPFAEIFVVGGAPAPEIVVVHTGQIVMDERVSVDAFDGSCGWHCVGCGASTSFCSGYTSGRTKTFSTCE